MSRHVDEASAWVYRGIWGALTQWFRVPDTPPSLPAAPGEEVKSFRPAAGFLRYLRFKFWVALFAIDIAILVAWLALTIARPAVGLWLAPVAFALAVFPDVVAYAAIHLQYDTTWYVLTQHSLRIRRGIWVIQETTITFENVQNVSVESGPLERWFGIAIVIVDTAGGGKSGKDSKGERASMDAHRGLIEGIDNASEIRMLILRRLQQSRSAGLGDEISPAAGWTPQHIAVLREIRDALRGRK